MKLQLVAVLQLIFTTLLSSVCYCSPPAKPLLKYDVETKKFILSDDALRDIEALTGPVKIVGAIGDARVGKSTNLNFIRYFLGGNKNQGVQKVFNTSDSVEACSTGVGISVVRDTNDAGSTILIDTEGTNLGNNENTDLLSIFTVLLSSGLALFAREAVQNHNVQFLYRVSRLSEQIWTQDAANTKSFPELMIILRGALSPSSGKTLQGQMKDFILDGKYGETIERHFSRDRIKVRDIPYVGDLKRLNDLEQFPRDDYANVASSLAEDFKRFPAKKTVSGAYMDGKMIADLARKLQAAINQNSWSGFSDVYAALETNLCDRSFREIVEPFLEKNLDEIKYSENGILERFKEKCTLEPEITKTGNKISQAIVKKEEIIEKQRRLDEERKRKADEEIREREREAQRQQKEREIEERLEKERIERERADEQKRIQEENVRRAQEETRRLEAVIAARRSRERKKRDVIKTVLGGAALFGIFSDSRLKENITAMPHSEFEEIGLQSYSWVWSKKAVAELGIRGIEHGVIAQEVEKLYPWAVVMGDEGYKRVNYAALKQLVVEKRAEFRNKRHKLNGFY
ncbi:PREDICTED: stress response protein NST1-like [Acropora digitifera]|uniref:stress response protein NST1-like n=1 Tax=Acropora digitifera TaxID=70779 RepID=UPI00077A79EE|nr:PREDICTED: stress response protein NST1-like [Acropora digitifera]